MVLPDPERQVLLIGQSLELWRPPLADAVRERDAAQLFVAARRELNAGAQAIDVNLGAERYPTLRSDLRWAATTLRGSFPSVPLFIDCGDLPALTEVVEHVRPPLVANAIPVGHPDARTLAEAAARNGAGVVCTPWRAARTNAEEGTGVDALLIDMDEAFELCERAGVRGPRYIDCVAVPATRDMFGWFRSLAWLRAARLEAPRPPFVPLVAVGNVGYGAPYRVRSALLRIYATLAIGAGARALILPVEDRELMHTIEMLTDQRYADDLTEGWLWELAAAAEEGRDRWPPPPQSLPEDDPLHVVYRAIVDD